MLTRHDIRIERAHLEVDAYDFGGRAIAGAVTFETSFDGRTLIAEIALSGTPGKKDAGTGIFVVRFSDRDEVVSVDATDENGAPVGRRWQEPESLLFRLHVAGDPTALQDIEDAIVARHAHRHGAPAPAPAFA